MKVQDVKKDCTAIVGLSIEFSNSEIGSLSSLLRTVSNAVEKGVKQAHSMAEAAETQYDEKEEIPVSIDLKSLKRIEWLLTQMTKGDDSGLFNTADADYSAELSFINNLTAVKQ